MSVCIALRDDYDSIQVRRLAKRCRDPRQVRRLLALAAAYDRHEPRGSGEGWRHGPYRRRFAGSRPLRTPAHPGARNMP